MSYLDPKADVTFKRVFGDPDHKERCISLLNALLPLGGGREVVDIEFLDPGIQPLINGMRYSFADLRCRDNHDRQFIVEMQMEWQTDFTTRILFNASKAFVSQFEAGVRRFEGMEPVYSLNFINDVYDRDPANADKYYHHYAIYDLDNPELKIEGMEFLMVELPKFKPGAEGTNHERDRWLRFLTEIKNKDEVVPEDLATEEPTREAVECLKRAAYTKEQLLGYDKYWDNLFFVQALTHGKYKDGHTDGKAEGRAEGLAEGEAKALLETARRMKARGVPLKTIAAYTGLAQKEVKKLP